MFISNAFESYGCQKVFCVKISNISLKTSKRRRPLSILPIHQTCSILLNAFESCGRKRFFSHVKRFRKESSFFPNNKMDLLFFDKYWQLNEQSSKVKIRIQNVNSAATINPDYYLSLNIRNTFLKSLPI